MAIVGLAEAAKLTRRSQSTIHRAMTRGLLSYTVSEQGGRRIDTAELARLYDLTLPPNGMTDVADMAAAVGGNGTAMPDSMSVTIAGHAVQAVELAALRRELEIVREERERERQETQTTIADLRRRLDKADERLLMLLADQRPPARPPVPAPEPPPRSAWRRFLAWRRGS